MTISAGNTRIQKSGAILAAILLPVATWCFFIALGLPLITMTENFQVMGLLVHHKFATHSLISGIEELYKGGQVFTAVVFAVFSLLTPTLKFITLGMVQFLDSKSSPRMQRFLVKANAICGKWSMLEIVSLAVFLFFWNQKGPIKVYLEPGYYYFLCAVLCSMAVAIIMSSIGLGSGSGEGDNRTVQLAASKDGTQIGWKYARIFPAPWQLAGLHVIVLAIALFPLWGLSLPLNVELVKRPGFTGSQELVLRNGSQKTLYNLELKCAARDGGCLVKRFRSLPVGNRLRIYDRKWLECYQDRNMRGRASGWTGSTYK